MKSAIASLNKLLLTGLAGLGVALIIGGAAFFALHVRTADDKQAVTVGQHEAVAAIIDAMNRSDAAGVLVHVDVESVFNSLLRRVNEADLKRPMTDEEFKMMASKTGQLIPQMREALVHGVTTQADKDAAPPGTIMAALVHLSEGKIVPRDDFSFSVVFADGTELKFALKDGVWVAVGYAGFDAHIADYRKEAEDAVRRGVRGTSAKKESTQGAEAAGTKSAN
ncbi:MAG: hypothetical protein RL272_691 [Candidatus Parcubacteria bacterium]|jgi:hypothetical protein